jgi:hypothetical protein
LFIARAIVAFPKPWNSLVRAALRGRPGLASQELFSEVSFIAHLSPLRNNENCLVGAAVPWPPERPAPITSEEGGCNPPPSTVFDLSNPPQLAVGVALVSWVLLEPSLLLKAVA